MSEAYSVSRGQNSNAERSGRAVLPWPPARVFVLAILVSIISLSSISRAQDRHHGAQRPETKVFGVGEGVYVRSLAIDKEANALWVGTSVGALQIDLATQDVKQTFTREDGLANEYVFSIGLPGSGDVWFGTNAGGASRYRNGNWKTFFPMHGLADYWVYGFAFDRDGKIWIGTWDGASHYDPKTDVFTNYRKELINIWVYGLDIDPRGRVWFGTEGGVSMLDGKKWRSWTHKDGLGAPNNLSLPPSPNTGLGTRSRHDLAISVDSGETYNPSYVFVAKWDVLDRGVWFGTWGGGLSLFDGAKTWKSYTSSEGLAGNIVYSLAQEADGTLWIGTNRGLSRLDGKRWTSFGDKLPSSDIYAIAIEKSGVVWLGMRGAVVRLRSNGETAR